MRSLIFKIVAAVIGALAAMVVLHGAVFVVTGQPAGPVATNAIWCVAMLLGFVVPVRIVLAYKRKGSVR